VNPKNLPSDGLQERHAWEARRAGKPLIQIKASGAANINLFF
jgi:hypothetical protein